MIFPFLAVRISIFKNLKYSNFDFFPVVTKEQFLVVFAFVNNKKKNSDMY